MKRLLFTLLTITTMAISAMSQHATRFPLHPIEADSIYFMDFFWHNIQQKALDTPITTTPATPWEVKKVSASHIAKMAHQWATATAHLNIQGEPSASPAHLKESLQLFSQSYSLNQLTGQARYLDLAEHLLVNSIIPLWHSETDPTIKDCATTLLRTISQMAYSTSGHDIYVNMPMRANAHIKTPDLNIFLRSVNSSPWYNETAITIAANNNAVDIADYDSINQYQKLVQHAQTDSIAPCRAAIHLRIPLWAKASTPLTGFSASTSRRPMVRVLVNGIAQSHPDTLGGYIVIDRTWHVGDIITIHMPTPIVRLTDPQHPDSMALQRGPFVYSFVGTEPTDSLSRNLTVGQTFSKPDNAVVLSGMIKNSDNRFFAIPLYQATEKKKIFMPAK